MFGCRPAHHSTFGFCLTGIFFSQYTINPINQSINRVYFRQKSDKYSGSDQVTQRFFSGRPMGDSELAWCAGLSGTEERLAIANARYFACWKVGE